MTSVQTEMLPARSFYPPNKEKEATTSLNLKRVSQLQGSWKKIEETGRAVTKEEKKRNLMKKTTDKKRNLSFFDAFYVHKERSVAVKGLKPWSGLAAEGWVEDEA